MDLVAVKQNIQEWKVRKYLVTKRLCVVYRLVLIQWQIAREKDQREITRLKDEIEVRRWCMVEEVHVCFM